MDADLRALERAARSGTDADRERLWAARVRVSPELDGLAPFGARVFELLRRANVEVGQSGRGLSPEEVANTIVAAQKAPAFALVETIRSFPSYRSTRSSHMRVVVVAVLAGGGRMGKLALGIGTTTSLAAHVSTSVGRIWPSLGPAFGPISGGPTSGTERELRESIGVMWASAVSASTSYWSRSKHALVHKDVALEWARRTLKLDSLPSGDGLSPSHPAADKEALPGSP